MDEATRQKAVQGAGEKLDKLVEATEANGRILRQIREDNARMLRQIRLALSWLVFLMIPASFGSCQSYIESPANPYEKQELKIVAWITTLIGVGLYLLTRFLVSRWESISSPEKRD